MKVTTLLYNNCNNNLTRRWKTMRVYAKISNKLAMWRAETNSPQEAIQAVKDMLTVKTTVLAVISKEVTHESNNTRPNDGPYVA